MARLTYPQEKNRQETVPQGTSDANTEADQILYLKRLLVTLKQQYEKTLRDLQTDLTGEQTRCKDLSHELAQYKIHHEEELAALRHQQSTLRELLKKAQNGVVQESSLETDQLKADLDQAQKALQELQAALEQERAEAQKECERLNQQLSLFEDREDQQELITSNTSSYQLRREMDLIKSTFTQGMEESKGLEKKYAELFNEKVCLEIQVKQLQTQLEHQSTNLIAFEGQLEELNTQKKKLELVIQENESRSLEEDARLQELKNYVQKMEEQCREKSIIQEKYEQLKEEFMLLSSNQEEAVELRLQAEQQMLQLDALSKEQELQLKTKTEELEQLSLEREHLHADLNHFHELLSDTESRLKTSQQHLAKKVKEAALLTEKVAEQQNTLVEHHHINETAKSQANQLQSSLEIYQKQEKRLQEQLHEALKGTESQVAKWESKYFEMYEKWQESENHIRELKKIEEKHLQMQNLLSNLGNFMGSNISPSQLFQAMQTPVEPKVQKAPEFDVEPEVPESQIAGVEPMEKEYYDMFGMRHAEKPQQPPFS